jgi:hypothetical protein
VRPIRIWPVRCVRGGWTSGRARSLSLPHNSVDALYVLSVQYRRRKDTQVSRHFRTFPASPFFSNMCSNVISSVPSGRPGAICSRGVYCVGSLKLK